MKPRLAQQAQVLEVALAPAAVAAVKFLERLGPILAAAREVGIEFDRPAGAPDPRGLDEVVTEKDTAKGRRTGKDRQMRGRPEGRDADQGVVAPVVAGLTRPCGEAADEVRRQIRQIMRWMRSALMRLSESSTSM